MSDLFKIKKGPSENLKTAPSDDGTILLTTNTNELFYGSAKNQLTTSWNVLRDKPDSFVPVSHSHNWSDINNPPNFALEGHSHSEYVTWNHSANGLNTTMIQYRDNPSGGYGHGIGIGGGGLSVLGGGESASIILNRREASEEIGIVSSDENVEIITNLQGGYSEGKQFIFDASGNLTIPGILNGSVAWDNISGTSKIVISDIDNMKIQYSGSIASTSWLYAVDPDNAKLIRSISPSNLSVGYASSAGSINWDNISNKPDSFTPSSHSHNYLKDKTNNTATYLNYASSALSNPTYLAGWDGYTLRAVNRSDLSVNYANSAGNADTVDGYHATNLPYATSASYLVDKVYSRPVYLNYGGANLASSQVAHICAWDSSGTEVRCLSKAEARSYLGISNSYLPLSGGTISGRFQTTGLIVGYNYGSAGNNTAAFIWDKPGSYWTGMGPNGNADTIHFGACDGDGAWVSYAQIWDFAGCICTSNYGSGAPGSGTTGYGRSGAIYFKIV